MSLSESTLFESTLSESTLCSSCFLKSKKNYKKALTENRKITSWTILRQAANTGIPYTRILRYLLQ